MDKLKKALAKLSQKQRDTVAKIIKRLHSKSTEDLDIKKLKGPFDFYRIRKGNIRIIYLLNKTEIIIHKIDLRTEDTYKF